MTGISPPPFRIYLLRHARAASARPGERDFDRPLDDEGYAEAEIVADKAADKGYTPDLVISSTAVRCRQTADAVRRAVGSTVEFRFVDELYNATLNTYVEIITSQVADNSVMLVGHNPIMEQALEILIGREAMATALPYGFPTAGLAVVDADIKAGSAETVWILSDFLTE
jgi:phosphohistidine phosphatase